MEMHKVGVKMEEKEDKEKAIVDQIYDQLKSNTSKMDVIEDRLQSLYQRIKEKFIGEDSPEEHDGRDKQAIDCSLMQVAQHNNSTLERTYLLIQKIEEFV